MSTFLITEKDEEQLKQLKEYAEKHPYTMDNLLDIKNGAMKPPGDEESFRCMVPVGWKIVYSIELQKYKVRHLSMSNASGIAPHPVIVEEVMKRLGFEMGLIENKVIINPPVIEIFEVADTTPLF